MAFSFKEGGDVTNAAKNVTLSEYTKFILQKLATKSSLKIHRP